MTDEPAEYFHKTEQPKQQHFQFTFPHDDSAKATSTFGRPPTAARTFLTKSRNLSENASSHPSSKGSLQLFFAPKPQPNHVPERVSLSNPPKPRSLLGSKIPVQKSENRSGSSTVQNAPPPSACPTESRISSSPTHDDTGPLSAASMNFSQPRFMTQKNTQQLPYSLPIAPKHDPEDDSTGKFEKATPFCFFI
jgi:hypothetical protein